MWPDARSPGKRDKPRCMIPFLAEGDRQPWSLLQGSCSCPVGCVDIPAKVKETRSARCGTALLGREGQVICSSVVVAGRSQCWSHAKGLLAVCARPWGHWQSMPVTGGSFSAVSRWDLCPLGEEGCVTAMEPGVQVLSAVWLVTQGLPACAVSPTVPEDRTALLSPEPAPLAQGPGRCL